MAERQHSWLAAFKIDWLRRLFTSRFQNGQSWIARRQHAWREYCERYPSWVGQHWQRAVAQSQTRAEERSELALMSALEHIAQMRDLASVFGTAPNYSQTVASAGDADLTPSLQDGIDPFAQRGANIEENRTLPQQVEEPHQRGINLLIENLSATQREQYATCQSFEVIGGESSKRYRIQDAYSFNIDELDTCGQPTCSWCFVPEGGLVVGDVMLAQKIALELFESDALALANRSPPRPPEVNDCSAAHSNEWSAVTRTAADYEEFGDLERRNIAADRLAMLYPQYRPQRPEDDPSLEPGYPYRDAELGEDLVTAPQHAYYWAAGFITAHVPQEPVRVLNGMLLRFEEDIEYLRLNGITRSDQKSVLVGAMLIDFGQVMPVLIFENGTRVPFRSLRRNQRAMVLSVPVPNQAHAEITQLAA